MCFYPFDYDKMTDEEINSYMKTGFKYLLFRFIGVPILSVLIVLFGLLLIAIIF